MNVFDANPPIHIPKMPKLGIFLISQSSRSIPRNLRPKLNNSSRSITSSLPLHKVPQPADDPNFTSAIDQPPRLIRSGSKKRGLGLLILALVPLTSFALGTWQVQRLDWKSDLIAKYEDRLVREPLPLPPRVDPSAIHEFDYRRVWARGRWRHDLEMLVGPRTHDGKDGYLVVTPFEREEGGRKEKKNLILVCRGWIAKKFQSQQMRDEEALPKGEVLVEGLLRAPYKKNLFTPANNLEKKEFYFPDVVEMAGVAGAQPVWVEETMPADLLDSWRRESRGIPVARPAEVNLMNNHAQYIFTWYALAAATSIMLWMVVKKPSKEVARRVRRSSEWP